MIYLMQARKVSKASMVYLAQRITWSIPAEVTVSQRTITDVLSIIRLLRELWICC